MSEVTRAALAASAVPLEIFNPKCVAIEVRLFSRIYVRIDDSRRVICKLNVS